MERLRINVHPTFILFACLLIYFRQGFLLFNYVLTIFLHEYSHAFVAKKLGYNLKNIRLIPFGICLNMKSNIICPKDEIKIALAGPAMNLVLCLLCFSLWWIFPSTYNHTNIFCYANFITCFFNFLPAFPLDGGRVMLAIIRSKVSEKSAVFFCKFINITLSILLFAIFIWSCFYSINFTYLFVIFCILTGVFEVNEDKKYFQINYSNIKKINKVMKIKNLYVKESEKVFKICKFIDNFSYINLYIYDDTDNLKGIISEKDYVKLLEK
ncbi:MAG: hypothetical protein EOM55_03540, partial [Clostridia bacterium]|nr:hypothetical protein [Clostridia bacterium]